MEVKIPEWESELWSYISKGEGEHCPFCNDCHVRQTGGWCPDDNKEKLLGLVDKSELGLSDYDSVKPGAPCGGIFRVVEILARKFLIRGGVYCPPVPTELVSLVDEQNPVEIRLLPLKTCHGATWYLKDGWVIQLKENDLPVVRRFALFHEAFHILAHCRTKNPVFRKKGSERGSFNELLADSFAVATLMPTKWVKEKWAEVEDLDQMTQIFNVPKPTMYVRLKRLGLLY